MRSILNRLQGFLIVNLGIGLFVFGVALIMTSYRGTCMYLNEFKEFKGAFSRTLGGDYYEAKADFVLPVATPTPEPKLAGAQQSAIPADFSSVDTQDLEEWILAAKGEMQLRK